MRDPARILLVRLSHLGDVVHALAVFHALHEAYPRARVAWAIQPEFADLVRGLPGLERAVLFERDGGWRAWPRLRRELACWRPELCVDAQGNAKSAAVALCSGAPRRAGLARADWREPFFARVLNERAPALASRATPAHAMDRMHALARFVAPGAGHPPRGDPALSDAERAAGERTLERVAGRHASPVLCHVSSPEDARAWPLARWGELAALLAARGRRVLALVGPRERAHVAALGAALPAHPLVTLCADPLGLRQLAALYAAAAARGGTLVACDTGPLHLAAASGLRVVALEGPQDARRTGPWPLAREVALAPAPGPHAALRARRSPDCAPCLERVCRHAEGPVCMRDLEAEEVAAALGT